MKPNLIVQQTSIEPYYHDWLTRYTNEQDIVMPDLWIGVIINLLKNA